MELAPGLHLLLGGLGTGMPADPLDCHVYGLRTAEGVLVFDSGAGRSAGVLLRRLAALEAPVRACFLTHAHADHSGGAAALAAAGIPVHAGAATARLVEAGDEVGMSLDVARRAGIYPEAYRFAPCRIGRVLDPGTTLRFDETSVAVLALPGHSADHLGFLVEGPQGRILFGGDALFEGGRVILQDTWDCSVPDTCRTVRRLAGLAFEVLLPGHGPVVLGDAARHVRLALDRVERLLPPALFL